MAAINSFDRAKELHQKGDLQDAEHLYNSFLKDHPANADAHHMIGALQVVHHGVAEWPTAVEHLKTAIRLNPSEAKYRHSLGKAYEVAEQWQTALTQYQFAVDKEPFVALYQMSLVKPLTRLRRFTRVVEVCRNVLALEPGHPRANFKCAAALRQLQREDEALVHYRRHLKTNPDDEQAHFWISILSGGPVSHAPAAHVASLFDFYADKFEEHLVKSLQYCTPEVLMAVLREAAELPAACRKLGSCGNSSRPQWGNCVDLGCGTGLMGPLLRSHVSSLDGVDLSAKMVDKARMKGCYDRLFVEDIVEFLVEQNGRGHAYDVFVAADVFVYLGDLAPLLQAAFSVSSPDALLAFSTESCSADECQSGYMVTRTGRFKHLASYVEHEALAIGWTLLKRSQARIRCNAGEAVQGDLFVFIRK